MSPTVSARTLEASGLEDVSFATTRLSDVDGEAGRLVLAGHPVEDLAGAVSFEDVVHLLWRGALPTATERAAVRDALGEARELAYAHLGELGDALALADPMDALRAATAHAVARAGDDPLAQALRIAGAMPVHAAAWAHGFPTRGLPLAPDARRGHAEDLLRLVTAREPSAAHVEALDAYLVTVVDHGMNASTFAARVVASTASDTVSAVVAGLGALKGRLHGGAPGPVLDMLDAIGEPANAAAWLDAALARGERIMGMGHRVYRVRDPRAFVLERAARKLVGGRLELARAVEREAEAILARHKPDRPLKANVEFYTAILLEAVGVPRALFTPIFASSRVIGWCAHVDEQRRVGRLVRPRSRYVDVAP